jgi:vacuolar-type H+-ATPase subunit I/STV1
MKKHPVDDLFKRRLAELDKRPSADAWLKIQERSQTQRRNVGWIWYAAASVLIVMLGGYLVWRSDVNGLIHPDNNQKVVAKVNSKVQVAPIKKIEKEENAENQIAVVEIEKEHIISRSIPATNHEKSYRTEKAQPERVADTQKQIAVAALEKKEFADIDQPDRHESPSIAPNIEEVKILPDEPAVSQVTKKDAERSRIVIVAVEPSGDELDDKPKNSRLSRVFRQLKNARAGERVDWEEVGFNPKTLVAKVDDRLHGRDEKASEKDQTPKQRIKL